jgi:ubiquinone/menaquinone biosynthesis C-methylase UbiE
MTHAPGCVERPKGFGVRQGLEKDTVRGVYDRVAGRYDLQHGLLTARSDQRGRVLLVERTLQGADRVLDAGGGTGSTALLAAERVGASGRVTLMDLSDGMLAVARRRAKAAGLADRVELCAGDLVHLPFADGAFDAALSTYSMCPLYDPARGALELYRVVRPGGRLGIAHSAEPPARVTRWLADRVESVAWRFPWLSLGCRSVTVLPVLESAGARVLFKRYTGVPLWPFLVLVLEKPT